jgi:hypothetical protein
MTKSRMAIPALIAVWAVPAPAQSSFVEQRIEAQRSAMREALRLDCPPASEAGDEEEIVVCGRRDDTRRYRVEPIVLASPQGADRAGGEQRAALAVDSSRCTPVGRDQQCTSGLNVIGIGVALARAVGQALANRD